MPRCDFYQQLPACCLWSAICGGEIYFLYVFLAEFWGGLANPIILIYRRILFRQSMYMLVLVLSYTNIYNQIVDMMHIRVSLGFGLKMITVRRKFPLTLFRPSLDFQCSRH
jgi:hypothetical protein